MSPRRKASRWPVHDRAARLVSGASIDPLERRSLFSSFVPLPDVPGSGPALPNDVSADGGVVVGDGLAFPGESTAFRWSADGGMQPLGPGSAKAVSDDGAVAPAGHGGLRERHQLQPGD
jgi:hypothetical protein